MCKILLVGSGRLARHLIYWNSISPQPADITTWNRKQNSLAQLHLGIADAEIVWLAISDSALISFYEQHLMGFKGKVVHFSGAIYNPGLVAAHPLMSFPTELLERSIYPKIHFVLSGAKNLDAILPPFKNSFSIIQETDKAFYHALCVIAGNFPQLLWNEVYPEFTKLKIPTEAVDTYVQQISLNFIKLKGEALTGPLIRNDLATIELNLNSLKPSKLKSIYQNFVGVFTK